MSISLIVRFTIVGLIAYFFIGVFFKDKDRIIEHHETERELVAKKRQGIEEDNLIAAKVMENLEGLGIRDQSFYECIKRHVSGQVYLYIREKNTDPTQITQLDCRSKNIQSLEGIEKFTKLKEINLSQNDFDDLLPLSKLTELTTLNLSYSKEIKSLWGITGLPIESLDLSGVRLRRIDELFSFTDLKEVKYRIDNEYSCIDVDNFYRNLAYKDWSLPRPKECVDQYGAKVPFSPKR